MQSITKQLARLCVSIYYWHFSYVWSLDIRLLIVVKDLEHFSRKFMLKDLSHLLWRTASELFMPAEHWAIDRCRYSTWHSAKVRVSEASLDCREYGFILRNVCLRTGTKRTGDEGGDSSLLEVLTTWPCCCEGALCSSSTSEQLSSDDSSTLFSVSVSGTTMR